MALPLPDQRNWLDPVTALYELQKDGPLTEYETEPGLDGRKQWLVTGYDEAREILGDSDRFSSMRPVDDEKDRALLPGILQAYDPPDHTRLRGTVAPAYSARRMGRLLPRVEEIAGECLDDFESVGSPADFVRYVAWPVPALIACELLGVPHDDQAELSRMIRDSRESRVPRKRVSSGLGVVEYSKKLAARERRDPGEGLIGVIVREHGDEVTDEELAGLAEGNLIMAAEQMAAQLGIAVLLLVTHAEQMALLREHPELVDGAIEEVLRYACIVETPAPRAALADVCVAGYDIHAGDVMTCSIMAINRAQGDGFDITRENPPAHLAFGHGIHHCLGAHLARAEGAIGIGTVLRRYPAMQLAVPADELAWRPSIRTRGLQSLPVVLTV